MEALETQLEIERLRKVYQEYAARGYAQSKWSAGNPGNQAMLCERQGKMGRLLRQAGRWPLAGKRILEVGCGTGENLAALQEWGAARPALFGIDLIAQRVQTARQNFPGITFQLGNAEVLPFADASFDLILTFTVFSSILNAQMAANAAREIRRLLRPGGAVLWYDFRRNNPWNRHVRGLSRSRIQDLFPDFQLLLAAVSLLPPLARRLGRLTPCLYPVLSALPWLRSHYLGILAKS